MLLDLTHASVCRLSLKDMSVQQTRQHVISVRRGLRQVNF